MKFQTRKTFRAATCAVACGLGFSAAGCGTKVDAAPPGASTRLTGEDVIGAADEVVPNLLESDLLADADEAGVRLRVLVLPVINRLTGQVMTDAERRMFTNQIQARLSTQSPERFVFLQPPEEIYALRTRVLEDDNVVELERRDYPADYALHATLASEVEVSAGGRRDTYNALFVLTDLASGERPWSDTYVIDKQRRLRADER
jgi:hypothetical protein